MTTQRSLLKRLTIVFCTFIMFMGVLAAPSFAGNPFAADKNDSPTPNIMKAAEKVAGSQPRSMEEIQDQAEGGLNGVQGTADYDKMKQDSQQDKPDNVVARKVDKVLDKYTRD